jgi:predicted flap endonuclease-1-like 5' DNA nuclease
MDESGLRAYLEKKRKSSNTITRCIEFTTQFEKFLSDHRRGKSIEEATKDDLEEFVYWLEENDVTPNAVLWGLSLYFKFTSDKELENAASRLRGSRKKDVQFKIRDFRGLKEENVQKLEEMGLTTAEDIREACKTSESRMNISKKSGIPVDNILEITKLSDLSRLPGVKGIRARLYYDAGVTTLDKLASWDPEELRNMLLEFVGRTGFDGVAPWPKEARDTVSTAQKLPRIIEY